ncbi:MAG: hypothetical protein VYB17_01855, partial [Candidatus Thermoplasmatota archaeon]|nr:hypothetical protein [Candidatus Thermoplasmatota archaeon]
KEASEDAMNQVKSEVQGAAEDLARRHAHVEGRIATWQSEGFEVPALLPLLAGEMIAWEAKLPKIAEQIESTHGIWSQMETHLEQWPEYRKLAERTRGHLNAIQALDVLLQGLTAKTEGAHAACKSRLGTWSSHGIDTSSWSSLVDNEPRAILEELDAHQSFINIVIRLIEGLQALDTSVSGSHEVENWLQQLRNTSAGMEVVEIAQDWLDLATKRSVRHREYLDRARSDLATLWPEELDSETLNLALYEETVSNLESGYDLPSSLNVPKKAVEVDERLEHVLMGLQAELDEWRHLGWSVEGLQELLAQDPIRLGLDLPEIRLAMDSHDARLARLEPLPWALDVELAERVLSDLMRPERLVALDAEYQELLLTLSNAEGESDPDFEFKPFRSQMPMARIEEKRVVLAPIVEDVVEDDIEEVSVSSLPVEKPKFLTGTAPTVKAETLRRKVAQRFVEDDIEEVVIQDEIRQSVRDLFGLGDEDPPLEILLMPPLDVRVQRLGRLAIILERGNSGPHRALQARLPGIAKKLENWTAERLSRRHSSSGQGLLKDAKALGERLADIPGPGAAMPLEMDEFKLPDPQDLEGITAAIKRLEKSVMLPSAMMQMPDPVES